MVTRTLTRSSRLPWRFNVATFVSLKSHREGRVRHSALYFARKSGTFHRDSSGPLGCGRCCCEFLVIEDRMLWENKTRVKLDYARLNEGLKELLKIYRLFYFNRFLHERVMGNRMFLSQFKFLQDLFIFFCVMMTIRHCDNCDTQWSLYSIIIFDINFIIFDIIIDLWIIIWWYNIQEKINEILLEQKYIVEY